MYLSTHISTLLHIHPLYCMAPTLLRKLYYTQPIKYTNIHFSAWHTHFTVQHILNTHTHFTARNPLYCMTHQLNCIAHLHHLTHTSNLIHKYLLYCMTHPLYLMTDTLCIHFTAHTFTLQHSSFLRHCSNKITGYYCSVFGWIATVWLTDWVIHHRGGWVLTLVHKSIWLHITSTVGH